MADTLAHILEIKREHVKRCKERVPHSHLISSLPNTFITKSFSTALRNSSEEGYGLIAEIKKASPSKGLIREHFIPTEIALAYEKGGASCLSVLTDEPFFQGKNEFLTSVRKVSSLPILRKDFMIDPYQITESRVLGADCILLIMAALDDKLARDLEDCALNLGMEVLVEVHNQGELERALNLKTDLIGVNNRNLKTMTTDLVTTEDLAPLVPKDKLLISESGLNTVNDLTRMENAGARCFLIGESLMRQKDLETATRSILSKSKN
jgi:indole-3-glycerol phosphate synthase